MFSHIVACSVPSSRASAYLCRRFHQSLATSIHLRGKPRFRDAQPRVPQSTMQRRNMAAGGNEDYEKAIAKILECGYTKEVAVGICDTLLKPESGIPKGMLHKMVTTFAGRPEVGEDAGLLALAKIVEQELARQAGKQLIQFKVKVSDGSGVFPCEGLEGMSLKEVAEHGDSASAKVLAEYLECACDGWMACSTCHVYIDPAWVETVGPPCEAELDMIELAHEPRDNSRLGCQIRLSPALDGLQVEIPGGANNLFDDDKFYVA